MLDVFIRFPVDRLNCVIKSKLFSTQYRLLLTSDIEPFRKYFGNRRKCWTPAFSPFPMMFSPLSKREISILATLNLSSASAFSLVAGEILLFGKGFTLSQTSSGIYVSAVEVF